MRRGIWILLLVVGWIGCRPSAGPWLQVDSSGETVERGGAVVLTYRLTRPAFVDLELVDAGGRSWSLRRNAYRAVGTYRLTWDGTRPRGRGAVLSQEPLPAGTYRWRLAARGVDGETAQAEGTWALQGDPPPPLLEGPPVLERTRLTVNGDGVEDETLIGYRLTQTATVLLYAVPPTGEPVLVGGPRSEGPGPRTRVWDGRRWDRALLPAGTYTLTVVARTEDRQEARGTPVELAEVGWPRAEITFVRISPQQVQEGAWIRVEIGVRNTGKVPLRTQGPPPGTDYAVGESYLRKPGGLPERGAVRVGVDWGNGGQDERAYPFRWGLGRPLAPGEETVVVGRIRVEGAQGTFRFYAGLIWEGVGRLADRVGLTPVEVAPRR